MGLKKLEQIIHFCYLLTSLQGREGKQYILRTTMLNNVTDLSSELS